MANAYIPIYILSPDGHPLPHFMAGVLALLLPVDRTGTTCQMVHLLSASVALRTRHAMDDVVQMC